MKITRDVVTDLLRAYVAGGASADSRALVRQFAGRDREFARVLLRRLAEKRAAGKVKKVKKGAKP